MDFCTFYNNVSSCPINDCDDVKGEYDYGFYWLVIIGGALVAAYSLALVAMYLWPATASTANWLPLTRLIMDGVLTFITFFASLAAAAVVETSEEVQYPVGAITTKAYFTLNSLYQTFEDCMYGNPVPMIRGGIAMLFLACFAMAVSLPISYSMYRKTPASSNPTGNP